MSDQEWLNWRREGITATDVVKLAGLSQYGGPLSVWLDKAGQAPDVEDSDPMKFGRFWELAANPWLEQETGMHVIGSQLWCAHRTETWARATPDGFMVEHADAAIGDALGVVEHKSFNVLQSGDIRPDVLAQVQWQLYVTDLSHAWVTGLIGRSFVWRLVERDEDDIAWLVSIAQAFRTQHMATGVAPKATAADLGVLNRVPADPDEVVELNAETLRSIDALREAKDDHEAAKRRMESLEAEVKQALGNASAGTHIGAPVVTWKHSTRKTIDTKALETEMPEVAERYRRTTETRTFRLTQGKTTTRRAA